jgi:myo-inositol catabolism protein IolS
MISAVRGVNAGEKGRLMDYVRLGRTELEVSLVSLGTWSHGGPNKAGERSVGWSGYDRKAAKQALVAAFEAGINHWDTADVYGSGRSEELIGEVLGDLSRSEVVLASKVGWDPGPHKYFYDPSWMRSQLESSLRRLGTDVLDIYYLHHCDFGPDDRYFDDALDTIRRFREEGLIRHIGLSDWSADRIMRFIERVDPDVVQPYRNLLEDDYASSGLKNWVETHDLGAAFFSPLKHGLLLGKYDAPTTFPDGDFRQNVAAFTDASLLKRLKENKAKLAERFSGHPNSVLYGIVGPLTQDASTACVLMGQRNEGQVLSASSVSTRMSEDDAAWVRALFEPDA